MCSFTPEEKNEPEPKELQSNLTPLFFLTRVRFERLKPYSLCRWRNLQLFTKQMERKIAVDGGRDGIELLSDIVDNRKRTKHSQIVNGAKENIKNKSKISLLQKVYN
jgi:hypothetical protein